jgi:hypothetical protein
MNDGPIYFFFKITEHRCSGLNNSKNCLQPTNINTAAPMLHRSNHKTYTSAPRLHVLTRESSPKQDNRQGIQETRTQEKLDADTLQSIPSRFMKDLQRHCLQQPAAFLQMNLPSSLERIGQLLIQNVTLNITCKIDLYRDL